MPGAWTVGVHTVEPDGAGASVATLTVRFEGALSFIVARLTAGITRRYVRMEAQGLARRSVDPAYRHTG
jgi:hypothetical protein